MECNKTNSSLDTLLILDYEEEIKSKKLQTHSSLDTLFINCEGKKHRRHYKNKSEHRSRNGEQRKKSADRVRTKYVTQEIHVEQQNFKCIINLNTTVCDHKNRHKRSHEAKASDSKSKFKERPVPHCLRHSCSRPGHHDTRFHRYSKHDCKTDSRNRTRHWKRAHECKEKTKHDNHRIRQHSRREKKYCKEKMIQKNNELKKISPPKKQLELTYEDISTKSIDSYLEVPVSYKHVAKNTRRQHHDSKLDTLIKRTKERERKLVEQSRNIPWYTSTPAYTDVSSVEFPMSCSDVDVSIHSRSTLILEPRDHEYSPPIRGLCQSPTIERYFQYSPKSIERYLSPNIVEKKVFQLKIKKEPTMDIGAYSPTQSADLKKFDMEQWIKKEIKIEPNAGLDFEVDL